MNLYDVFLQTVRRQPEHVACLDLSRSDRCSYRLLLERIDSAAQSLEKAGTFPGACIGLHCGSGLEYIVWAYAIWKCGGTIVPIAVELVPEEKAEICQGIGINGVITARQDTQVFGPFQNGHAAALTDQMVFLPTTKACSHPPGFSEINAAFIRFTSGTTATSKGVVLSHETVCERIHAANEALEIGPSDTVIWLMSMSYHFTVSVVAYLSFGATIVLCSDHFGSTIVQTAVEQKASLIYGSPQHYRAMVADRSDAMLPSLRLAISTASRLKSETADAFLRRFGIPLSQAYGIIEVGLPCINLNRDQAKRGSVGRPLPAYEIRMRDMASAGDLKAIDVRGKGLIDAYYSPWKTRAEIMPEGWFETGDLGQVDEDGYLYILGRSKEMISVGGMKLFPQEVEAVLESHPAVKEACVFAQEDDRLGEVPSALVTLTSGSAGQLSTAELREYCLRHLTAFKVPQQIEYVDQLPRTASGKLRRWQVGTAPSSVEMERERG